MVNFIICIIFIIIIDFFLCRTYSSFAQKKFQNKQNIKIVPDKTQRKKSLISVVKSYIPGISILTLRLTGFVPSFTIRHFIYKNIFLMKIGKGSKIRGFVEIIEPWNIEIGENTMIGQECKLDGRNGLYIGNNVNMSDCAAIWTEQHDINDKDFACNDKGGKVIIEDRVWLGFRSIVLPKITVKEGTVLASGALATKDCEEFSLYAGIPAKKIKDRNKELVYSLDIDYMHFI